MFTDCKNKAAELSPIVERAVGKATDYWSLRLVRRFDEQISVRNGVVEPPRIQNDFGCMITVASGRGIGYSATCDLTPDGISRAAENARYWANISARATVIEQDAAALFEHATGEFEVVGSKSWESVALTDKIELLTNADSVMGADASVADRQSTLWSIVSDSILMTSKGGVVHQRIESLIPMLSVSVANGNDVETRTLAGQGHGHHAGMELLEDISFGDQPRILLEDAKELIKAPKCPEGTLDLILSPDQMMLQIHESIGHPIELDRILGDERNYAGTSFVNMEMFGNYQYGSELLNVTFDPTLDDQLATYRWDDDGSAAKKVYLIEAGILKTPLGGALSQARSGMGGTANSRADRWNRPPIDRMGNINVETGDHSLDQMIGMVDDGVMMTTNRSWSIDDSRNKFQFGCELGRRIRGGKLGEVVRNPNYRGISASFWRSLAAVGDQSTFEVYGTPFCGKGEPNQVITVGHASPACLFKDVAVFGGG